MKQRGGGCLEKRKSVPFNFKSSAIAYVHSIETPRHIDRIRCSPVHRWWWTPCGLGLLAGWLAVSFSSLCAFGDPRRR